MLQFLKYNSKDQRQGQMYFLSYYGHFENQPNNTMIYWIAFS